jgi:superfamily II DNA/RNA helicase
MTRIRSIFTRQLQTVVLDEADRLAMNKDLCEQTATILQLLTGSISSNDLPTTAISEGQRQNEMVRKVMCSATWPDRATPAWKSWVSLSNEPCIVVRVDAVAVTAHARPKAPGQLKNDTPDAKEKKENDVADNEIDQDASGNELDMVVDNHKPNSTASNNSSSSKDLLLSRIPANLTQVLHVCAEHKKPKKLLATLETIRDSMDGGAQQRNRPRGIVFFAKIKTVQYIATFLEREASQLGYAISSFHSQMSQPAREQALRDFAAGKVSILLATDIAARGIHANNVKFVINYDFPSNLEQYVHRCGRAGRGGFKAEDNGAKDATQNGNQGTVYSFFTRNLAPLAADLITLLQSSNQWVDPNLLLLVEPQKRAKQSTSSTKKEKRKEQPSEADNDNWGGDDDGPDDPFMNLSAKRIVLKRALNVSDASDDDDEDDK